METTTAVMIAAYSVFSVYVLYILFFRKNPGMGAHRLCDVQECHPKLLSRNTDPVFRRAAWLGEGTKHGLCRAGGYPMHRDTAYADAAASA